MSLWLLQHLSGRPASREALAPAIAMQSQMTSESMRKTLEQSNIKELAGGPVRAAMEAMDRIPAYLVEILNGAYLKGLAFVFAVHAGGWSDVDKLYGERPPVSTEQILHPEKWTAREGFVQFTWNGDRYAVFKREDSEATLLLLRTSWDTVADATEFAALYRRLLAVKYEGASEWVRVLQRDTEVTIVEGGSAAELDGLLELINRASATPRS